jgi:hypothetical protein
VYKWEEVLPALNAKKIILAPWCGEKESEEFIKKESTKQSLTQLQMVRFFSITFLSSGNQSIY